MPLKIPQTNDVGEWLQFLSSLSTPVIAGCAVLHLLYFAILRQWYQRDLRIIAGTLDDYTRGLKYRSILGRSAPLTTQIDAFVQDVNDVITDTSRHDDRAECLRRIHILDEKRRYLESVSFETSTNMAKTMIEAYPLGGVLGTVLAIGSALQADSAAQTAAAASSTVNVVMERFGDSIWSTFTGLFAAILLMFINSFLEVRFNRLAESRTHVRDMVGRAKRELGLAALMARETA
jgi:biopolymer transport protein ExbB/TolQ